MTQELQIRKDQQPVLMKSLLIHWVSIDTAERLQEALSRQNGHTFVKVSELGITINTAQIEGVYTLDQYADIVKIKQGMWQCEYKKWHERNHKCECKAEMWRQQEKALKEAREIAENRELSPEEFARMRQKMNELTEEFKQKGIIPDRNPISRGTCIKCPNRLPPMSRYYCSGACMVRAQEDGTYGREEELQEAAKMI